MKNLFFALALLFAAFFNACQENSITDPISSQNSEKNIAYYNINDGQIRLNQHLSDPRQGALTSLDIIGNIDFAVRPIKDPVNDVTYNAVVKMKISAIIRSSHDYAERPSNYTVYKETEDYVDLSQPGARTVTLVKRYELTGCREMRLMCTYQISRYAVTLSRIALCCEGQVTILPTQY